MPRCGLKQTRKRLKAVDKRRKMYHQQGKNFFFFSVIPFLILSANAPHNRLAMESSGIARPS